MRHTTPLSNDVSLFNSIYGRYVGAIFVVPIFTIVLSTLSAVVYVDGMERSTRFIVTILTFNFSLYIGWRLNGVFFRLFCGWTKGQTQLVFDEAIFPGHWIKPGGIESLVKTGEKALSSLIEEMEQNTSRFKYARHKALSFWGMYVLVPYFVDKLFKWEFSFKHMAFFSLATGAAILLPIFILNWFKHKRAPQAIEAKEGRLETLKQMQQSDLSWCVEERQGTAALILAPVSLVLLGVLVMFINHNRTVSAIPEIGELEHHNVHIEEVYRRGISLFLVTQEYETKFIYDGEKMQLYQVISQLKSLSGEAVEVLINPKIEINAEMYQLSFNNEVLLDYETSIVARKSLLRWGHWVSYLLWLTVFIWVFVGIWRGGKKEV